MISVEQHSGKPYQITNCPLLHMYHTGKWSICLNEGVCVCMCNTKIKPLLGITQLWGVLVINQLYTHAHITVYNQGSIASLWPVKKNFERRKNFMLSRVVSRFVCGAGCSPPRLIGTAVEIDVLPPDKKSFLILKF